MGQKGYTPKQVVGMLGQAESRMATPSPAEYTSTDVVNSLMASGS